MCVPAGSQCMFYVYGRPGAPTLEELSALSTQYWRATLDESLSGCGFKSNDVAWLPLRTLASVTYDAGLRGPAGDPACERNTLRGRYASIRRDSCPELTPPADRVGSHPTWGARTSARNIRGADQSALQDVEAREWRVTANQCKTSRLLRTYRLGRAARLHRKEHSQLQA